MELNIENKKYNVVEMRGVPVQLDSGLILCEDETKQKVFLAYRNEQLIEVRGLWD